MNTTRRSFLSMLGVSAIAPALPAIPPLSNGDFTRAQLKQAEASLPPVRRGLRLSDAARNAMANAIVCQDLYLMCTDMTGTAVGPAYQLPAEFWQVKSGIASFRGNIQINEWDGPSCTLWGVVIMNREREVVLRYPGLFNQAPVMIGDTVSVIGLTVQP